MTPGVAGVSQVQCFMLPGFAVHGFDSERFRTMDALHVLYSKSIAWISGGRLLCFEKHRSAFGQHGFALKSIVRLCSAWATRLCIEKHCFDVKSIAGLSGPHGFALKSIAWFSGPHGFALHSIAWRSVLCRTWVLNLHIVQLKVYEIFVISFCPAFLSKVGIIFISLAQEFISVRAFSFQSVCLILIFLTHFCVMIH